MNTKYVIKVGEGSDYIKKTGFGNSYILSGKRSATRFNTKRAASLFAISTEIHGLTVEQLNQPPA